MYSGPIPPPNTGRNLHPERSAQTPPPAPPPGAAAQTSPAALLGNLAAEPVPETLVNPIYSAGYLRTQIGRVMRVEFLIGNALTDRIGRLSEVGTSYIVLESIDGVSYIMCDLYSIKFAHIIDPNNERGLFIV